MDPISQRITEQAAEQATQQQAGQAGPKPAGEVDAKDQAEFENALNSQSIDSTQNAEQADMMVYEINPGSGAEGASSEDVGSLGDAILDSLQRMKSSHDARAEGINEQMKNIDEMSVADISKMQFEIMQMGFEQEITGKIADKSSQGVQTLFKPGQ